MQTVLFVILYWYIFYFLPYCRWHWEWIPGAIVQGCSARILRRPSPTSVHVGDCRQSPSSSNVGDGRPSPFYNLAGDGKPYPFSAFAGVCKRSPFSSFVWDYKPSPFSVGTQRIQLNPAQHIVYWGQDCYLMILVNLFRGLLNTDKP